MAGRIILDLPNPALDGNGAPISGSTLTFYENGTTILQDIFTDNTLVTPLTNPLTDDSAGRFVDVWADTSLSYSVVWKDDDGVTLRTFDDILPLGGAVDSSIPDGTVIGNNTGSTGPGIPLTPSEVLDIIGSTHGMVLFCAASGVWTALPAGTDGQFLQTRGSTIDPMWAFPKAGSVSGEVRNLAASLAAAGNAVTVTAEEIIVAESIGGVGYKAANFSQVLDVSTTGAGGMDTGASPVSGYVAIYASYKADGTEGIFAQDCTAISPNTVYGGANIPSGCVATALLAIWPTDGSGLLVPGILQGRMFHRVPASTSLTADGAAHSVDISAKVPKGAKSFSGYLSLAKAAATSTSGNVAPASGGTSVPGYKAFELDGASGTLELISPFADMPILTAQTTFVSATATTATLYINGYKI